MPEWNNPENNSHAKLTQKRKEFEQACCEYMEEFEFEWVEGFTLNGVSKLAMLRLGLRDL